MSDDTNNRYFSESDYISGDGMLTSVWGPSLWHYLHTMSFNYPVKPSSRDKKSYRAFILQLEHVLPGCSLQEDEPQEAGHAQRGPPARDQEAGDAGRSISFNPIRIVSTPQGFVSLTEHSFASKHFDFWTLHYNHDITKEIAEEIEKCEGVETINIMTRYRARIGFNRPLIQSGAFNLTKIRKNIEKKIISVGKEDLELKESFRKIESHDSSKENNK